MNKKQLLELKEKIEEAEREDSRLEGRLSELFVQMKEKFGCESLEELENFIKETKKKKEEQEEEFDQAVKLIEDNYEI